MPAASAATIPRLNIEDWTLLRSRLAWCYEGAVDPAHRRFHARRSHLAAWWILSGHVVVRRERAEWRAGPGRWLLAGPDPFSQEFSADARILSVNFSLEWPAGGSLVGRPLVLSAADHPGLGRAARTLVRFIDRRFPGVRTDLWRRPAGLEEYLALQHVFSGWILAYLRAVLAAGVAPVRLAPMDARVADALRRLDRHRWAEPLREADLAAAVGLSPGHLDRLFVRDVGLTPRAYLQDRRLAAARSALRDPRGPLKTVAIDLGFRSASQFSHWLRKAEGCSPREYRRRSLAASA